MSGRDIGGSTRPFWGHPYRGDPGLGLVTVLLLLNESLNPSQTTFYVHRVDTDCSGPPLHSPGVGLSGPETLDRSGPAPGGTISTSPRQSSLAGERVGLRPSEQERVVGGYRGVMTSPANTEKRNMAVGVWTLSRRVSAGTQIERPMRTYRGGPGDTSRGDDWEPSDRDRHPGGRVGSDEDGLRPRGGEREREGGGVTGTLGGGFGDPTGDGQRPGRHGVKK